MAKFDTGWAIIEIDRFSPIPAQVHPGTGSGLAFVGTVMRGPRTEASERAHVIQQILDRALPGWSRNRSDKDKDYSWLRDQASRAKVALRRQVGLAEKLEDNAPDMDAANLHPWAWENGRLYWKTRHYHQTVMHVAIRMNVESQAKLGRKDISETALFNEAFSLTPPNLNPLGGDWSRMTATRRTKISTVGLVPLPRGSTLPSATLECAPVKRASDRGGDLSMRTAMEGRTLVVCVASSRGA